ncbi:unnamed protein product [Nippostrongylus brasiliensis]|uniref:Guanylate cyclase n=1 Tax=Nippostrongylus brasiliensis TaxID=27835 RepID=A0A158R0E0_NIPBR|nr:unnamed protein product [Nippostrongylus brasiliensis]
MLTNRVCGGNMVTVHQLYRSVASRVSRAWFIVAIAIFIFAIIFCIIAIIKYRREKVKEEKRLNTLWQISFARLKEPNAKIRQFEHENLNRFIGLCLDGHLMLSLWKYCTRGSINDVIERNSIKIDGFFVFALLKDIVQWFKKHFLPLTIQERMSVMFRYKVNVAQQIPGWQNFAIIAAQLITKTRAWDLNNRKEEPDEIIYMLKKGGYNAPRPNLEPHETVEANPALLHLIRDCWTEHPSERPTIAQVRDQLRSMQTDKNANLMDYVFNMLESYASSLEQEVDERTKELVMEKRKSDILLYRMLPRQVAEKLKLGQTVEPESYESVTLFFSDVVSFTTIAAKGSPLQVVNLLNSLYTIFDSIIDEHDVYKASWSADSSYEICTEDKWIR